MLGRERVRAIAVLLLCVTLAGLAAAQADVVASSSPQPLTGALRLDRDLRVEPGETLVLGPGTHVSGPGRLLVYGNLTAVGTALRPIALDTPVYFFGSPQSTLDHVRVGVASGFALLVNGANVRVSNATFDGHGGSGPGLLLQGEARGTLVVRDTRFVRYAESALTVSGPGVVDVARSDFRDNEFGISIAMDGAGASRVRIADSRFVANPNPIDVQVRAVGATPSSVEISGSLLRGSSARADETVLSRAGLSVRERTTNETAIGAAFEIRSIGNRYESNPRGISLISRIVPSAVTFTSVGDRFDGNGIGFQSQQSSAEIRDAVFANSTVADVDVPYASDPAAPVVRLVNSTYSLERIRVAPGAGSVDADGRILRAAGVAAGAAGAVGLLAFLLSDVGRQLLARIVVAPLYARLRPSDVLLNPTRRMILDYVTTNPGAHMRRVGHDLEISYGTLAYHLYRLERDRYVASREEGLFKRFYPATGSGKAKADSGPLPTALRAVERDILNAIIATPGSPQSAIAQQLGVSRQSLHYHIKKLESQGFISKVPRGRETLVYAREEAVAASRAAAEAAAAHALAEGAAGGPDERPPGDGAGSNVASP